METLSDDAGLMLGRKCFPKGTPRWHCEGPYGLGDTVTVKAISEHAKVRCIQVDVQGMTYKVSYWHDCKLHEVWVYPDELEAVK